MTQHLILRFFLENDSEKHYRVVSLQSSDNKLNIELVLNPKPLLCLEFNKPNK